MKTLTASYHRDTTFLQINGDGYLVRKLDCRRAELNKPDGTTYVVTAEKGNVTCTCPGYTYRRGCKHADATRFVQRANHATAS